MSGVFFCSCEQSLSSCEVRLATSCGARRHFGLWGGGQVQVGGDGHWDVQGPGERTSFGLVSWTQHVACLSNFADVFIVEKCIFQKSLGPGICSRNPTSLLLDSRLQSTVSLFGYSISLCLCELRHVVFIVLNFHYPQPPSIERPHQVRVGVVESSCNTPPVFSHLQIQKCFSFHHRFYGLFM